MIFSQVKRIDLEVPQSKPGTVIIVCTIASAYLIAAILNESGQFRATPPAPPQKGDKGYRWIVVEPVNK